MIESHRGIFEEARELMARARLAGLVIRMHMPTVQEKRVHKTVDHVVVSEDAPNGKTLLHPEPTTYGVKHG